MEMAAYITFPASSARIGIMGRKQDGMACLEETSSGCEDFWWDDYSFRAVCRLIAGMMKEIGERGEEERNMITNVKQRMRTNEAVSAEEGRVDERIVDGRLSGECDELLLQHHTLRR